jgi:2-dehydro-3-deoxyphosphogluconate aldolase/(4S)-4-hydroxy-2-oxoglutarate aldolase
MNLHSKAATQIRQTGIIAIIRGDFPFERLLAIAGAIAEGGVSVVEVTLNSRGALEGIAALRRQAGDDMLIGAGTVRTLEEVNAALDAGAQFLVSPNFDPASVARSQEVGVLHLPGVFTASEAQTAYAAGCQMVKLFPADALGPRYLKALRAPLNDIDFVPTGGIEAANIADFVRAGAVAFGVGSSLVKSADQDLADLREKAARLAAAFQAAQ